MILHLDLDLFKVLFTFYHGKSPLNHHLRQYFFIFPSISNKSRCCNWKMPSPKLTSNQIAPENRSKMLPKGDENYLPTIHFQWFQLAVSVREGQISTGRYGITVPMDLFTPLGGTRNGSKVGSNNKETPPKFVWFVFFVWMYFLGGCMKIPVILGVSFSGPFIRIPYAIRCLFFVVVLLCLEAHLRTRIFASAADVGTLRENYGVLKGVCVCKGKG